MDDAQKERRKTYERVWRKAHPLTEQQKEKYKKAKKIWRRKHQK